MAKKVVVMMLVAVVAAVMAVGCGSSGSGGSGTDVSDRAEKQIADAKAALADAEAKGVTIPEDEKKKIDEAQSKLDSDSVEALILATEAKADIDNDVKDAFNLAEQTYNTCKGTAEGVIKNATAGADMTQANQSLQKAEEAKASAKTIQDWYNDTAGPIYWANLAAQQAAEASLAKATTTTEQQTAAATVKIYEQGSAQIFNSISKYLQSQGHNPADYKIGITKISQQDPNWITAAATPVTTAEGVQPVPFLFHYENGNWVMKAGQTWTAGFAGAPSDMVP
ncbi:MAG: hypothetical protein JW738_01230 [Actinobacteria bacterium]|nr:hypothetical protein [Actinomycetota bacterium]